MNQRNPLNQKHAHHQSQLAGVWRKNPRIAEQPTHAGQHGEPCSFTLLSSLLHTGVGIGTVTGCLWPKERMMYSEKGIFTNPKLRINTEKMSEIFKYKTRESDWRDSSCNLEGWHSPGLCCTQVNIFHGADLHCDHPHLLLAGPQPRQGGRWKEKALCSWWRLSLTNIWLLKAAPVNSWFPFPALFFYFLFPWCFIDPLSPSLHRLGWGQSWDRQQKWMSNISLHICTTTSLSVHLSVETQT